MRRLIPQLTVACCVIAGIVFAAAPELDLRVARAFYDPVSQSFPLAKNPVIVFLRDFNMAIDFVVCLVVLGAVLLTLLQPWRTLMIPGRAVIFLVLTYALAPGVMANGVFKSHSSRPRPIQLKEFHGPHDFKAWWDFSGACERNCSFLSGEVSSAAWTLAPAVLVPAPWRPVAVGAALVFTATIAVVRMAAGGHFLSDTIFAFLLTVLLLWGCYELIYHRWRRWLTDDGIDQWLTARSLVVRRWWRTRMSRKSLPSD